MEVFIVEWLLWYGQYLVCTKYLIIEWLVFLPLNGCYGMHKILKILHSLTHQNITSIDEVSYYNANPLTPLP